MSAMEICRQPRLSGCSSKGMVVFWIQQGVSFLRMEKTAKKRPPKAEPRKLKGWREIAGFLGQPVSVAHRWASEGMPLKREGTFVVTTTEELNNWLGRESGGEPVQVADANTDLAAELKRGLAFIRKEKG